VTFSDIFYLVIIPVLTAVVVGYAVNLYARMRERTRARAYSDRIEMLDKALTELRSEAERMHAESDARALLLQLQEKIGQFRAAGMAMLPEIALNLGMLHFSARQWDEAINLFGEAIEADPTNRDARINLGNLLLRRRRFEEARVQFQELIELSNNQFEGHLGLGLALVELGRLDDGIDTLSTAIRLRPDHARSYCELGRAYVASGQLDRALESAQVALKLEPAMAEGRLLLQEILIKSGNFAEAVEACQEALKEGKNSRMLYNLAVAHTMGGDYEAALEALRKAVERGREDILKRQGIGPQAEGDQFPIPPEFGLVTNDGAPAWIALRTGNDDSSGVPAERQQGEQFLSLRPVMASQLGRLLAPQIGKDLIPVQLLFSHFSHLRQAPTFIII